MLRDTAPKAEASGITQPPQGNGLGMLPFPQIRSTVLAPESWRLGCVGGITQPVLAQTTRSTQWSSLPVSLWTCPVGDKLEFSGRAA